MHRVDLFPTHEYQGLKLRPGRPYPFGATVFGNAVNFSIYSRYATSCTLVLFHNREEKPFIEIPFFKEFRLGNVFSMMVFDLDYENIEYGYRMDGPFIPEEGHRFDKTKILLDPYAKLIAGRDVWGKQPNWDSLYQYRARVVFDDFDWEDDLPLETPVNDLIVYEMHVRNFTCGRAANVKHPGTFAGIVEKIPYLLELGVNCVELMPVHEFDEFENSRISPVDGRQLYNLWGYSNVGFFAPKAAYASTGKFGMQVDELKNLVKRLHANGIEVILDVVFNHTAEGNERGPYISYRGIDNKTYYMLTPDGYYFNFSGCGNTLNCNNPNVRDMIVESLRYWVTDYHIDGFRFDLAAILGRDQNGNPMSNPPLLESLAHDPVLGKTKLIAEAWDAGGLYQVGSFPSWGRWAEWNGKFRDSIRRFLKSDEQVLADVKERIIGSPDLYASQKRGIKASVNFVTAHDGFTLMDLVSYNSKHNEANGENNRDGENENNSWNCGWEGDCDDAGINRLRHQQVKNAITLLMVSQGIPMVLSGDEMGNSQQGNNNAYCQDNEIAWLDWNNLEKNADIFRYFKQIIKFRRMHKVLRYEDHLSHSDYRNLGDPDFSWHGVKAWKPECGYNNLTAAFMLNGQYVVSEASPEETPDDFIYVAMNMHWEMHGFELPLLPQGKTWHVFANTGMAAPEDIFEPDEEPIIENQHEVLVGPRSIIVLWEKVKVIVNVIVKKVMSKLHFQPIKGKAQEILKSILQTPEMASSSLKDGLVLRLACEEVVMNITSYAYPDNEEGFIDVETEKTGNRIVIRFKDGGEPFNPLEQNMPDTKLSWKLRRIGGLGIFLVMKKMDDIRYAYEDNMNILTLEKEIKTLSDKK